MAKRIRIIPWLDRDEFDKQLNKLGKEKHKINVDVKGEGTEDMVHKLHAMNSAGTKSTSIFGKLKNVISNTFSVDRLTTTGYIAVLRGIDTAADKAKDSIEALNKAETDLMIATDMTRESVRGLMKDYNSYAKELASKTENISDAANDYLRAGKTLEESQALIKDSIMLSKLGDIESATATEDLLATMNGYEMSIEGVDRALDAMVAIDMKAATSAGDLATGLKYSASSANSAGLSFNKLIAILGTVQDKTMMSAEVVGTFANQMLSRYRDITIGKYLSDDGEDISNYESVLKSCGLELRNSQGEFRAFEDILEEMAGKWDSLTSVQQNALIKVAAGTRQQNRFIALMEGYNKVLELTEVAANSAGTAVDKFNSSYMTSLEAKENTLQASFESMIYNSDLEEVYGDILDATTALVDFIDQTNALKGVMTGLAVTGGIKGFLTIKTAIHDAYINLNQFQNALNMVKQTNISSADFDRLLLLTNNLSESQMRLILSTDALSISQKEDLLVARGLSREEAKLKLQTYGVTQAQTGLTASTTSAKTAMQGFISVLKANPLFVIATAISAVSMAVSNYKNHLEEVRQATEQSASAYKESASSIDDYVSRYQDLQKALQDAKGNEEETYAVKQQLLALQNELNDKYRDEYGKLNLVTDAYRNQTEAIKALNKEESNHFLNENHKGIQDATDEMEKERNYVLSSTMVSLDTSEGKKLQKIIDSYADDGMYALPTAEGTIQIHLDATAESAYETINAFETDARNLALKLGNEHLFDDILSFSSDSLEDAKSTIDKHGEIYNQAQMAKLVTDEEASSLYEKALSSVEEYNQAVMASEDPFNDEKVAEAKNNVESIMTEAEGLGKFGTIFEDVFNQADRRLLEFNEKFKNDTTLQEWAEQLRGKDIIDLESMVGDEQDDVFDKLVESAEKYGLEVNDVIDTLIRLGYVQSEVVNEDPFVANTPSLDDLNNQMDSIQSAYEGLTTACEEYNQHGYITADTLQTLLALDSEYLACLINENGQLAINGQTYQALVQAKLADAEATAVQQAIEELGTITTEQQIQADTTAIGVMAEKGTALATLTGQYASLANVAISAAEAQALADAYTDASGKNKEEADRVMSNLNAKLTLIQSTAQNTSGSFGALTNHLNGFSNASKGASKSTDALTESMKKQKEALEKQKDEIEKQKQYYEDVSDAVNWFYDKQIEKQEKFIDGLEKENELLEERLNDYDGALSAIDRYYEKQIEGLEKQKDALEGNNKETEIAINLEKRQQELREARNRKSVNLYEKGKGFVYTTDSSAIRDAEENLADAQRQKEEYDIDVQIDKLKEYQKLWSEIPSVKEKAEEDSKMVELLGAEWESILLEGRIQNISSFKDKYIALQQQIDNNEGLIKSYEEKISYYENLKEQWDALTSRYEEDTYRQLLIGEFGNEYENILLNGRTERWEQFADDYYNVQVELKDITDQIETLAQRMEEYASKIESAANNATKAITALAKTPIPTVQSYAPYQSAQQHARDTGKAYAKGTRNAKKGISIVAEEGAEIVTDGESAVIATEPTLVNMRGGETVYTANETEKILSSDGLESFTSQSIAKNQKNINSLLSGEELDLTSFVNKDGVIQQFTPTDIYSMLEDYRNLFVSDAITMSRFNIPNQDFSKFGIVNNAQKSTVVEFKGDIVLQGVQDVEGFAKAIKYKFPMVMERELGKRF